MVMGLAGRAPRISLAHPWVPGLLLSTCFWAQGLPASGLRRKAEERSWHLFHCPGLNTAPQNSDLTPFPSRGPPALWDK